METSKERLYIRSSKKEVDHFINNGPYDGTIKNLAYKIMRSVCGVGPGHPDYRPQKTGALARASRHLSFLARSDTAVANLEHKVQPSHIKIIEEKAPSDLRPYDWATEDGYLAGDLSVASSRELSLEAPTPEDSLSA